MISRSSLLLACVLATVACGGSTGNEGAGESVTPAPEKGEAFTPAVDESGGAPAAAAPEADAGAPADTGAASEEATPEAPASEPAPSDPAPSDPAPSEPAPSEPESAPTAPAAEPASPPADPPPPPPVTTTNADAIVAEIARELAAVKSTTYVHTTFVDEAKGIFNYDCSGFVSYALHRAYPTGFEALRTALGADMHPKAAQYESFFEKIAPGASKSGWMRVARVPELRKGDIVAWVQPPENPNGNTGHVMFVDGAPTKSKRADEWIVPIVDATSSPHGPSDSRTPSDGEGLGKGSVGLIVDSAGAPTGYYWSGGYSSTGYSTPISLGRAQ